MAVKNQTRLKKGTKTKVAGKRRLPKKTKESQVAVTLENVTIFNIEKLGLRSGIGDLSRNWHHYAYGTEKGR